MWRLLRGVFLLLAALVIAIEEWGWRPLTAWAARIARWPPLAALEARIRRAPPKVALGLFLVPALMLFPIKLAALWLIHRGHAVLGLLVIVAAKLVGTALVGRLFILAEPQLMQFPWFVRALTWWRATQRRVHAALFESPAWLAVRRERARLGATWRRLFGRGS